MIELFDACMQRTIVFPEWHREKVVLLCRITQQKGSLFLSIQQSLSLEAIEFAKVETWAENAIQIPYQTVDKVNLKSDLEKEILLFDFT